MRRPPRDSTAEAQLITIYWRDIPAQVLARAGNDNARVCLSDRFQRAIDQAAVRAGKTDHVSYQGEWREERTPCSQDVEHVVEDATSRIEQQFPNDVLDRRARNGGWAG